MKHVSLAGFWVTTDGRIGVIPEETDNAHIRIRTTEAAGSVLVVIRHSSA